VGLVELLALAHIKHESDRSALDRRVRLGEATSRAPTRATAIMLARVSAIGSDRSDGRPCPLAAPTHRNLHRSLRRGKTARFRIRASKEAPRLRLLTCSQWTTATRLDQISQRCCFDRCGDDLDDDLFADHLSDPRCNPGAP
jgi:hypothetical protein